MYKSVTDFIRKQFNTADFIPLHAPLFTGNERKYVIEAIDSSYVSSVGKFVNHFEEMIKDYTGSTYAVATVNGTAALHMALIICGVEKEDIVITQPLTFIATCNAINYTGATPLFTDIDPDTLSLSYTKLRAYLNDNAFIKDKQCFHKITGQRIKACIPMHTFGQAASIEQLSELCNEFYITLIEDAAESLGTTVGGKQTGTFGKCGVYSFNGNKTITCGGGGMIVTNDAQLGKLAKHLTTQAKVPHEWDFVHDHIGYNYRLPNINAALACAQMEQLEKFVYSKRELAAEYREFFSHTGISFVTEGNNIRSNYWLNAILLKDKNERDEFLRYTNDNGVMTRPCWRLMNKLDMFKNCPAGDLSNAEWVEDRLVNIPSSVILKD